MYKEIIFTSIDDNWRFHYGAQAALPTTEQTATWRQLDLPHDWSVETDAARAAGGNVAGPFSSNAIGTTQTGWTVGGEAWNEKTFTLSDEQMDKLVTLYFEGLYNQSTVFVNGKQVYFNPYGYSSFRFDIMPYLNTVNQENRVLVKVQNDGEGTLLAAGNASPTDMASFRTTNPRFFEGRALAIIRTSHRAGTITLKASCGAWQKAVTISTALHLLPKN